MNRKRGAALAAVGMIAAVLIGANVMPSGAQQPPPPIATEFLTGRATFTDDVDLKVKFKLDGKATGVVNADDPSRTVVARFTVQPGAQFPWHTTPARSSSTSPRVDSSTSPLMTAWNVSTRQELPLSTPVMATSTPPSTPPTM